MEWWKSIFKWFQEKDWYSHQNKIILFFSNIIQQVESSRWRTWLVMPCLCCWQKLVEWPQSIQHCLVHRMHPPGSKQKPASSSFRQSHRTVACISGNRFPNPSFKLPALLFLSISDYGFLFCVYLILFWYLTLAHGLKCFSFFIWIAIISAFCLLSFEKDNCNSDRNWERKQYSLHSWGTNGS